MPFTITALRLWNILPEVVESAEALIIFKSFFKNVYLSKSLTYFQLSFDFIFPGFNLFILNTCIGCHLFYCFCEALILKSAL